MSMSMDVPARSRIEALVDPGSFVEIGAEVVARSTDFNLSAKKAPSDGVITGYGLVDAKPVYLYSQDASVLSGTIGEMHAKKIVRLIRMAMRMGAPVIGMIDSAGMRLEEAGDALFAFGEIYQAMSDASGLVPQIAAVFGNCGGGCALIPALSDFRFMEEHAKLFLHAPNALPENTDEKCDTAAADFQSKEAGLADFVGSEDAIIGEMKRLLAILPANNEEEAYSESGDDLNRLVPDAAQCADDPAALIARLVDGGQYFARAGAFGTDTAAVLARLGGNTVGILANGGAMSAAGAAKATGLVKFCDAFSIPLITLTNLRSFVASREEEAQAARAMAAFVAAMASANTARINLITKEAFGTAGLIMNSRALGADMVYAWRDAHIGMMDAESAAKLISADEGSAAIRATREQYDMLQNGSASAAARGYVDAVIDAAESRKYLIGAIELLYTKSAFAPEKKHGTI